MRRVPRLLLAVLIALGSLSVPVPAHALPETWIETSYYHCRGQLFYKEVTTCFSYQYSEGTFSEGCGDIRMTVERYCSGGEIVSVTYERHDGCEWHIVAYPELDCMDCPC